MNEKDAINSSQALIAARQSVADNVTELEQLGQRMQECFKKLSCAMQVLNASFAEFHQAATPLKEFDFDSFVIPPGRRLADVIAEKIDLATTKLANTPPDEIVLNIALLELLTTETRNDPTVFYSSTDLCFYFGEIPIRIDPKATEPRVVYRKARG